MEIEEQDNHRRLSTHGYCMKPNDLFYSEKQRFRKWWIWLLILIPGSTVPVVSIWAIFQQVIQGPTFGDNPLSDFMLIIFGLIFGMGFGLGIPFFMYITGLDTELREHGIYIRFHPFHRKWVVFPFERIQNAISISYSPLKDYGGWGIRYGRNGKAYNVSGNNGVLLVLDDGKKILIGSKNHEVLYSAINERISSI